MKRILRNYLIETGALLVVSNIASGMEFQRGSQTFLLAGLGLTVVALAIKPIINILLLPLNLITFGLFRWVSAAVALYLVTLFVSDFKVLAFNFHGASLAGFELAPVRLGGILAVIVFSFLISIITSFFHWLVK